MSEASKFPIDYDSLNKGDIIPVNRVEQIVGKKQDDPMYQFALLKFTDRIQRELQDRGQWWTVRTEKGAVKILTDTEAVSYNHAEQVRARSAQLRRFALQQAVDVTQLDNESRKEHERNLEVDGKHVQALLGVREQFRLSASKRSVPGLPDPKG